MLLCKQTDVFDKHSLVYRTSRENYYSCSKWLFIDLLSGWCCRFLVFKPANLIAPNVRVKLQSIVQLFHLFYSNVHRTARTRIVIRPTRWSVKQCCWDNEFVSRWACLLIETFNLNLLLNSLFCLFVPETSWIYNTYRCYRDVRFIFVSH